MSEHLDERDRWAQDDLFCAPKLYDAAFSFDVTDERDRIARLLHLRRGQHLTIPACGTGRLAEAFGRFGCEVEAFDLNPAMIAYATRARPHPRVAYSVADMTTSLGTPGADAVIVLCNSFRYILDPTRAVTHLQLVHAALKPGGRYLIDLGLDIDERHVGVGTRWSLDFGDSIVHAQWRLADVSGTLGVDEVQVIRVSPSGVQLEQIHERQPQRLWSRSELARAAEACGFSLETVVSVDGHIGDGPGRYYVVLEKPS